jgi:hypothetical protein
MAAAAFAAWALTALGGLTLALTWIIHGGMRQERQLQDASLRDGAQTPAPPSDVNSGTACRRRWSSAPCCWWLSPRTGSPEAAARRHAARA